MRSRPERIDSRFCGLIRVFNGSIRGFNGSIRGFNGSIRSSAD